MKKIKNGKQDKMCSRGMTNRTHTFVAAPVYSVRVRHAILSRRLFRVLRVDQGRGVRGESISLWGALTVAATGVRQTFGRHGRLPVTTPGSSPATFCPLIRRMCADCSRGSFTLRL